MVEFKWYIKESIIYMEGTMYECSDFSGIFNNIEKETVKIDLSGIKRINSIGVLNWSKLVNNSNISIEYINCSTVIVEQFAIYTGFLGENSKVTSFYARYYCEVCKKEVDKLFNSSLLVEIKDELPKFYCKCKHQLILDDIEEDYIKYIDILLK